MAKIGILGGTFDPVHIGHLMLAEQAAHNYGLSKVLFIPSGRPPHKDMSKITPARHRVEMVRLAIGSNPLFEVSELESDDAHVSYTYSTLDALRRIYGPGAELYYIIGSDVLNYITKFINFRQVLDSCVLIASARPGGDLMKNASVLAGELAGAYGAKIELMKFPEIEISSSMLRAKISGGEAVRYMAPDAVIDYIARNGLYAVGGDTAVPGYWESIPEPRAGCGQDGVCDSGVCDNGACDSGNFDNDNCDNGFWDAVDINKIVKTVASRIPAKRFAHSLNVMETAAGLAAKCGANPKKAALAGILHDIMRDAPAGELIAACESGGYEVRDYELLATVVLHAPAGAIEAGKILRTFIEESGGKCDRISYAPDEIGEAIACHTAGRADMGLLAKILFVSDMIEPGREYDVSIEARKMLSGSRAGSDALIRLDETVLFLLEKNIEYLAKSGHPLIHPDSVHARNLLRRAVSDNQKT